jgi:hypothetical protein
MLGLKAQPRFCPGKIKFVQDLMQFLSQGTAWGRAWAGMGAGEGRGRVRVQGWGWERWVDV